MKKKIKPDVEITELFMAKADWNRTFIGTILRYTNSDGGRFITAKVPVHDCTIWSLASDDKELGLMLDGIVTLILDYNLHTSNIITYRFSDISIYLN